MEGERERGEGERERGEGERERGEGERERVKGERERGECMYMHLPQLCPQRIVRVGLGQHCQLQENNTHCHHLAQHDYQQTVVITCTCS